ncbi:hypothetical protein CMV_002799 [Castanea mollissima]|uniref:Myb/SANT-like domain-containing protein n=1 Tax=Castanea mollissima TaxID=60419 RepID=A0A8J4S0U0_9ROSI|nr:hypothetical protein CMV_002799 [Castanea mollissima]
MLLESESESESESEWLPLAAKENLHLSQLLLIPFHHLTIQMGNKKRTNVDKRDIVKWTERWDDFFVEALVRQQSMGNRIDKVFTTKAYDNIVKELREKIGKPFEKDHLKNRMKTLKHNFNECYDLFKDTNGFTWSSETKMWTAKPEVWKALIKVKPGAKKWMTTPIANYDKLLLLFAKERDFARGSKVDAHQHGTSRNGSLPYDINQVMSQNEITLTLEDLNDMNDGTNQLPPPIEANSQADSQPPSQSATSLKGKKRKAPRDVCEGNVYQRKTDVFEREFESIREAIKDVARAIREGNVIAERGRPRVYSEQEVFTELVKIGVDVQLRYKAYTFLVANAGRVRAFFGCPAEERTGMAGVWPLMTLELTNIDSDSAIPLPQRKTPGIDLSTGLQPQYSLKFELIFLTFLSSHQNGYSSTC